MRCMWVRRIPLGSGFVCLPLSLGNNLFLRQRSRAGKNSTIIWITRTPESQSFYAEHRQLTKRRCQQLNKTCWSRSLTLTLATEDVVVVAIGLALTDLTLFVAEHLHLRAPAHLVHLHFGGSLYQSDLRRRASLPVKQLPVLLFLVAMWVYECHALPNSSIRSLSPTNAPRNSCVSFDARSSLDLSLSSKKSFSFFNS